MRPGLGRAEPSNQICHSTGGQGGVGGREGVGNVRPLNQRPAADGVDDTARAQKRIQRHGPNAGTALVVMQRRIGMRAHVGR